MAKNGWAVVYGFIMMVLFTIVNAIMSNLFGIDIELFYLSDIIFLLGAIWYSVSEKEAI